MEYAEFVERLPELREEAQHLRGLEEKFARQARGVEKMIDGIETYAGLKPESPPEPQPAVEEVVAPHDPSLRGIAAIRELMRLHPERTWKAREVHQALEERGWVSTNLKDALKNTESAIWRLRDKGEIVSVEKGVYRYFGEGGA